MNVREHGIFLITLTQRHLIGINQLIT